MAGIFADNTSKWIVMKENCWINISLKIVAAGPDYSNPSLV